MNENEAEMPVRSRWFNRRMVLEGVLLGAAYGLFVRLEAHWGPIGNPMWVMTVSFLVLGPMVMGFLVIRRAAVAGPVPVWQWIVAPWLSVLLWGVGMLALWLEGFICVVMALPIALVAATLGGVIGGLVSRNRKISTRTTLCVAVIPFLLAPAESRLDGPTETRTVESQIVIHASPEVVWRNVERVPEIAPSELHATWAQRIGFPRPVEATLSYEGIGGVRHASFERGLLFVETVTAWEPDRRIAFSIKADTAHIPPTTLDEHVTIGGRYFDVLDGEYILEPLANGDVLLHLTSHQRLSTDFNGYAGMWTDAVMQSLQTSILQVIQHRCEATATAP